MLDEIIYQTLTDIPRNLRLVVDPPEDMPDIRQTYDMQSPTDFIMGIAWGQAYYSFVCMFTLMNRKAPSDDQVEAVMQMIHDKAPQMAAKMDETMS